VVAGDARIPRQRIGIGDSPLGTRWERQIDDLAAHLIVDVECERWREAAGNVDHLAVGHNRNEALDPDLRAARRVLVELQFDQPPRISGGPAEPGVEGGRVRKISALQVLRTEE
jgi:hypothetical protein